MRRGTGRTTRQMKAAPEGAVFVWCNDNIKYPRDLAADIGRSDLDIRPLSWLKLENVAGRRFTEIAIDHAARLHDSAFNALLKARAHITPVSDDRLGS